VRWTRSRKCWSPGPTERSRADWLRAEAPRRSPAGIRPHDSVRALSSPSRCRGAAKHLPAALPVVRTNAVDRHAQARDPAASQGCQSWLSRVPSRRRAPGLHRMRHDRRSRLHRASPCSIRQPRLREARSLRGSARSSRTMRDRLGIPSGRHSSRTEVRFVLRESQTQPATGQFRILLALPHALAGIRAPAPTSRAWHHFRSCYRDRHQPPTARDSGVVPALDRHSRRLTARRNPPGWYRQNQFARLHGPSVRVWSFPAKEVQAWGSTPPRTSRAVWFHPRLSDRRNRGFRPPGLARRARTRRRFPEVRVASAPRSKGGSHRVAPETPGTAPRAPHQASASSRCAASRARWPGRRGWLEGG
jgi:hypothetical protein